MLLSQTSQIFNRTIKIGLQFSFCCSSIATATVAEWYVVHNATAVHQVCYAPYEEEGQVEVHDYPKHSVQGTYAQVADEEEHSSSDEIQRQ